MKLSYYPGCSLEGTSKEYSDSLKEALKELGIELEELPDWTCCGASSAHATSDGLATSLAGRNMIIADKVGQDLMIPCAACFQRLKAADKELKAGKKVEGIDHQYRGEIDVKHSVEMVWDKCGEKAIAAKVKKPLTGLRPVSYYGCLITRPPKITDAKNPEDPQEMDEILRTLGADVKNWSYKTDCCGGNLMMSHPELAKKLVKKLYDAALEAGADSIVVACPMCQSNLDAYQHDILKDNGEHYNLPVYFFSELMELAFGLPTAQKCLNKHLTDGKTLLKEKGLI
jgi:heterodisulfide reductase subunit B